jgi:formylglycine-generating enzyme required for sulfatase activity
MTAKVPDRVSRGGSWAGEPRFAQNVNRCKDDPSYRGVVVGIRLVEVVDDPAPVAAPSGSNRVDRGGGWGDLPQFARVAYRSGGAPGDRRNDLGIRLVEVIDDSNPHVPRNHRFVRGGSWRFKSAAHDRKRAYPCYRSSNLGIRLVEVIDE